ncbi:macrophage-expressed gene 1 protein-like [Clytia hemisphaerica]|uniref:MACPF domain-containing protein n=1 Tax=Clytia hemisphaerica TaxID=252671 RepID=A0A7M6DL10_9CNID
MKLTLSLLKESHVELTSDYFDHWNNYTSTTSTTINVQGFGITEEGVISGKLSTEFRSVKSNQVDHKAVTTRVQLRHKFYTVKSKTDTDLHPNFKSRLLDIASHIQLNNTKMARYLTDLVVRDYGTHYITSIDAGAVLSKIDHIKSTYARQEQRDSTNIRIEASALFELWGASTSISHTSSTDNIDAYKKSITASSIKSHGGPPFGANFTVKDWEAGLVNNLAAIDRAGDPLYYAIEQQAFPELPDALVFELANYLKHSIKSYYKHNLIKGCTNPDARDFNVQAILDDHSCEKPFTNFTFGGVFQSCEVTNIPHSEAKCDEKKIQKNPKTDAYTCEEGYQPVFLHRHDEESGCKRHCKHFLFWSWHCRTYCGTIHYSTYWCAATGPVKQGEGFLFGGMYNKLMVNPLTGGSSCPPKFYPQVFGPEDMFVCISDDYELSRPYSIPFSGFFSCSIGNPLALKKNTNNRGPNGWPKSCPENYAQHLAVVDDTCEINYCVKVNSLSALGGLAPVRQPPFRSKPKRNMNITIPLTIINDETKSVWFKSLDNQKWTKANKSIILDRLAEIGIKNVAEDDITHIAENVMNRGAIDTLKASVTRVSPAEKKEAEISKSTGSGGGGSNQPVSNGTAVGITIGVLAIVLIIVLVAVTKFQRKKKQHRRGFNEIPAPGSNEPQTDQDYHAM